MDIKIQTTQQQRGEHHLVEGTSVASAPESQHGTEPQGVPGPVTEPIKGESIKMDGMETSQQKSGEMSLCEGK